MDAELLCFVWLHSLHVCFATVSTAQMTLGCARLTIIFRWYNISQSCYDPTVEMSCFLTASEMTLLLFLAKNGRRFVKCLLAFLLAVNYIRRLVQW